MAKGRIDIIIAEESYIIRRGLARFLDRFEQVRISAETDTFGKLVTLANQQKPAFIFSSGDFLRRYAKIPLRSNFIHQLPTRFVVFHRTGRNPQIPDIDYRFDINLGPDKLYDTFDKIFDQVPGKRPENAAEQLSVREATILKQIASGKTTREIGEHLHISPLTVETHRKNITRKLGIKSVSGLTIYAIVNKLIDINHRM